MKKLFLLLLVAGLFAACGTKKVETEVEAQDTVVVEAVDTLAVEEAPVAEVTETVAPTAPKTNVQKPKTETKVEEVAKTVTEEVKEAVKKAEPVKAEPEKPATPNKPRR